MIKFPDGQQLGLADAKDEVKLNRIANNFSTSQNVSDALVDNKIITPEASKNTAVQSQIRQLHSMIQGLNIKDETKRQQLANFQNHLEASRKLGRAVRNEDFNS